MPDADTTTAKPRPCLDAVKKAYAVSDAVYDVTNSELIGEDRTTVLNLLTEARNLALECGCDQLVDAADALRIQVVEKPKVSDIQSELDKLKQVAKECLKLT